MNVSEVYLISNFCLEKLQKQINDYLDKYNHIEKIYDVGIKMIIFDNTPFYMATIKMELKK